MLALSRVSFAVPVTLRCALPIGRLPIPTTPSSREIVLHPRERKIVPLTRRLHHTWTDSARLASPSSLSLLAAGGLIGVGAASSADAEEDPKAAKIKELFEKGHRALKEGNYLEAHQKLDRALTIAGRDSHLAGSVRLACADLYYALGEWSSASQCAIEGFKMIYGDDAFKRSQGDPKVRSHVMLIKTEGNYHANRNPKDAKSELEEYVLTPEQNPADGAAYWLLKGQIELQEKQEGKARECVAQAEKYPMHKPERHKLYLTLAELYKRQNDSGKALDQFQLALMQASTDLQQWHIRMEMGAIYEGQGKLKAALEQYKLAKELNSLSPDERKDSFAECIAVSPEKRHASSQKIVQLYIRLGELAEAGATFQEEAPQAERVNATVPIDASNGLLNVRNYTTPHADYAVMSQQVYQTEFTPPEGWRVYDSVDKKCDKFGYYGRVYINHQSKEIVIAHRGTYPLENWRTNIKMILGVADQLFIAARLFSEVAERSVKDDYQGYRISHTGHSLGGAIAEVMACRFNREAVTFDSPGSKPLLTTLQKMDYLSIDPQKAQVMGYYNEPNFLNTAMEHVGLMLRIYTKVADPELAWYERAPIISWFTTAKNELADVTISRHSIASIATLFAQSQRDGTLPLTDRIVAWPDEVFAARFDTYEKGMKDFLRDRQRVLKGDIPPELCYKIKEYDNRQVNLTRDLSGPAADFIRAYLRVDPGKRTNPYGLAPEVLACATLIDDNTLRVGKGLIAPEFVAYVNKMLPKEPKAKL